MFAVWFILGGVLLVGLISSGAILLRTMYVRTRRAYRHLHQHGQLLSTTITKIDTIYNSNDDAMLSGRYIHYLTAQGTHPATGQLLTFRGWFLSGDAHQERYTIGDPVQVLIDLDNLKFYQMQV